MDCGVLPRKAKTGFVLKCTSLPQRNNLSVGNSKRPEMQLIICFAVYLNELEFPILAAREFLRMFVPKKVVLKAIRARCLMSFLQFYRLVEHLFKASCFLSAKEFCTYQALPPFSGFGKEQRYTTRV